MDRDASAIGSADGRADEREESKPSLLLIGRDRIADLQIFNFLARHGFNPALAGNAANGLARAFRDDFDMVLLDVGAPGIDGFEVLRQLRQRSATPVVVLAEHTDTAYRIQALESGADDYLEQPFALKELLARIRAVLRRFNVDPPDPAGKLRVGDIALDASTRVVQCRRAGVRLSATESELLVILMRAAGRVVSRDEFATALYQRKLFGYERSVDIRISQLRKKLARAGASHVIRTVRGIGYLFILD